MLTGCRSRGRKTLVIAATITFVLQLLSPMFVPSFYLPKAEAASGNIYYVAKNGSDSNPGTEAQPFLTIQRGINAAGSGDIIYVRGGVYSECVEFWNNKTNITLKNYPGETPIVRGSVGTLRYGILQIDPLATYITIDGLTMDEEMITERGDPDEKLIYAVYVYGSYNTVRNMKIIGSSAPGKFTPCAGIGIRTGDYNLIENNTVTDIKYDTGGVGAYKYIGFGIYIGMDGAHNNTLRGNTVLRCHNDAIFLGGDDYSEAQYPHHTTIEYNTLGESRQEDGIMFQCPYVAGQDWRIRNCIIRYNKIYNNPENGIDLKGTENIQIYGNSVYGNQGNDDGNYDGLSDRDGGNCAITHGWASKSTNVSIYNNLVYDNMGGILIGSGYKVFNNVIWANNRDYTGSNSTYDANVIFFAGIQMHGLSAFPDNYEGVVIKNNIVGGHRHGEIALKGSLASSADIDNNLYFDYIDPASGQNQGTRFMNYDTHAYLGFSQWKQYLGQLAGLSGKDASSLVADPKFADLSGSDFHLLSGSSAIDAGASDGAPTTDKDGNTRLVPYDVGAYEYQGTGGLPPSDTTPPNVSILQPSNGATVSGIADIEASASDNVGVTKVEFYIDDVLKDTQTTPGSGGNYSFSWESTIASNGTHTIKAKAYDTSNLTSESSITVTVSNPSPSPPPDQPTVVIDSPASGSTVSDTVAVGASASDDNGVAKVEFYLDGEYDSADTAAPYNMKWYTKYYSRGNHTIMVKAYDNSGNSSSHSVTVFVNSSQVSSYASNEVVVKFNAGTPQATIDSIISQNGLQVIRRIGSRAIYRLRVPSGISVPHMISKLLNYPEVKYAEPNYSVGRNAELTLMMDMKACASSVSDGSDDSKVSSSSGAGSEGTSLITAMSSLVGSGNSGLNQLSLATKESQGGSQKSQNSRTWSKGSQSKNTLPLARTSALGPCATVLVLGLWMVFKKLLVFSMS